MDDVAGNRSAGEEAREIVGHFRALRRHLVQGSRAELARSGLTAAQLSVVSLLGNRDAMTLGEMSRELELSHSTVSGIVDRLQARGVVTRTPSPDDRRYVRIALADRIKRQHPAPSGEGPLGRLESALAAAPPEDRRIMREGLELLRRYMAWGSP